MFSLPVWRLRSALWCRRRDLTAKTPEATQRPSDGQDDAPQWHEQRRQEEAARAERMYDLPMDADGPRFDEPDMDTFTAEIPEDLRDNLASGEPQQIGQALVA